MQFIRHNPKFINVQDCVEFLFKTYWNSNNVLTLKSRLNKLDVGVSDYTSVKLVWICQLDGIMKLGMVFENWVIVLQEYQTYFKLAIALSSDATQCMFAGNKWSVSTTFMLNITHSYIHSVLLIIIPKHIMIYYTRILV